MAAIATILEIAEQVRQEQPVSSIGSCQFIAGVLAARLVAAGYQAVRVNGYYVEAGPTGTLAPFGSPTATRTRWDGVWMHWWVECEGFVVDVTADQVGAEKRGHRPVQVLRKSEAVAYCDRLPQALTGTARGGQFEQ